ncbi:type I-B CRISPR-associated protein Cas8b1/Cst1, partial [Sulfurihydrogenibium sp.]|uniref:type I-B CRISPR-associated protein Cas8b1/Cst1 n=1 Tax=Sulfurihydrogenibium sp. TaxID=2053621 RepID=UPI0026241F5F
MKEGNKERVYLSDWLYNAGILGFLKINSDLFDIKTVGDKKEVKSKDENMLKIGENYIEFDRKIFKDFSKRFFNFAFNQYLKFLYELIETLKDKEKFNYVYDRFKNLLTNYSLLKKKLGNIPPKKDFQGKEEQLKPLIEKAIGIMEQDREFWESEVQNYLRKIYGQKSFLNKSVNKDRFKKFYEDFEVPLTENNVEKDKKYYCISCNERKAKKDSIFDTGISKFYGLNPDAVNFAWNFNSKLPLCEICEIVYFSYFAAFTPMKKGDKTVYYFVNSDSSIYDLIVDNLLLEKSLNKENPLLEFFTELILESSYKEAVFTLQNIQILEIDLSEEVMP